MLLTLDEALLVWSIITLILTTLMTIISTRAAQDSRKQASQVNIRTLIATTISRAQEALDSSREYLIRYGELNQAEINLAKRTCKNSGQTLINLSEFCGPYNSEIKEIGEQLLDIADTFDEIEIGRFIFNSRLLKDNLLTYVGNLVSTN